MLMELWETIVNVAAGDDLPVQPCLLRFDWGLIRDKLLDGMGETGYDRYVQWYGSKKRRLDTELESESESESESEESTESLEPSRPSIRARPAGSSATVRRWN
jgi:hypothetical protein